MSANPRAIIYTRVSTGMQVENTSLEMQEAACKRKAGDMCQTPCKSEPFYAVKN